LDEATESEPARPTARLVALIAGDGNEPAAEPTDREARGGWAAATAIWHPALLAAADDLPTTEPAESPGDFDPRHIRVVADGSGPAIASGLRTQAADAGAALIDGSADRSELVGRLADRLGVDPGDPADPLAADFFALGAARRWLRDLTIGMGHADLLDLDSLRREALAGARAWAEGDRPAATNRLRAAFEILTQARERFYPVDAHLVDLLLIDPSSPAGSLAGALAARAPFTALASAKAIDALAGRDPESMAALRAAIADGWADVIGGPYDEVDEPLRPVESILWQFRKGSEVYRTHLDDRNVETLAGRRFGLYPMRPQLGRRFGFRFALHLAFDEGVFPVRPESKRLWEAPDGTTLEALLRPPLAADREAAGAMLAWRLAKTMRDDHVATIVLAHWPEPAVAPWYLDLRRVAAYSPVLARWSTAGDYFHLTDRPFETARPTIDDYVNPYLDQAVALSDPSPIGDRAARARLRARFDAADALRAMAAALGSSGPIDPAPPEPAAVEEAVEQSPTVEAESMLARFEPAWAGAAARGIVGDGQHGRPGYLVLNTIGEARRVAVTLPGASADLRPAGALKAVEPLTDGSGVLAVVELAGFGFAWVPRDPEPNDPGGPEPAPRLAARGLVLSNDHLAVELDPTTGGVRSVRTPAEETARIGQQLVWAGLPGPDGQPSFARPRADSVVVERVGTAEAVALARGHLLDPADQRPVAAFRQSVRLQAARPVVDLEIEFSDLNPGHFAKMASGPAWTNYLGCRWAWPDPGSSIRRLALLAPETTTADRPETPEAIDVATRRQRTALLFGGLAHHRRHGTRMLDTLLVAGRESARRFAMAVALDLEHPWQAAADLVTPAAVVPTMAGPPRSGPSGWLFGVDHRGVAVTKVEPFEETADALGRGLAFHLIDTTGRAARVRLRLFRDPAWARLTDLQGEVVMDLPVDGDAVLVDLTPRELARVEVGLESR